MHPRILIAQAKAGLGSVGQLIENGTPTQVPDVYALAPQNGGREILKAKCQMQNMEIADDRRATTFVCPFGGTQIRLRAEITLDAVGDWSLWNYLTRGQNFSHRSTLDKGLAVYFDGTDIRATPFQTNLELEETITRYLQPHYPLPIDSAPYELETVTKGKKIKRTACTPKGNVKNLYTTGTEKEILGLQKEFDCPTFDPLLVGPLATTAQGSDTLYYIGNWTWRRFSPTKDKLDVVAQDDQSPAFFTQFSAPILPFATEEDLVDQLVKGNVFEAPPLMGSLVSQYGAGYNQLYSPAACQITDMVSGLHSEHFVFGNCQLHPGENFKIDLERNFDRTEQGDETFYEVSNWNYTIGTESERDIASGTVTKKSLTIIEDGGKPVIIQHDNDEQELALLQEHLDSRSEGEFFPTQWVLRSGLGYVYGNRFGSSPPGIGDRSSQMARDSHEAAAQVSDPNQVDQGGHGVFGNVALEVHPIGLFSTTQGGPFIFGGVEGGYAGEYGGQSLNLIELQGGAGLSVRDLVTIPSSFDFSVRFLFWRRGWTNEDAILPNYRNWGFLQPGGCLSWNRWNLCVDYSQNERTETLPTGKATRGINSLKVNLGFDLLKIDHRPQVEIVK